MNDNSLICPKCGCEMAQGFVPGPVMGLNKIVISQWMAGAPEKSFWTGVKGIWSEQMIPIATFRCVECGFLESYARSEFAPK